MTTIINKSAAEFWGLNWSPDVAYTVDGQPTTFADLKAERIARQKEHLQFGVLAPKGPMRRAAHVWTFYVPCFPYMGWHLYVRTIKNSWWVRDCDELAINIMKKFPCGLLPLPENFDRWKEAFAKEYSRPSKHCRKQGMVSGWINSEKGWRPDAFYC